MINRKRCCETQKKTKWKFAPILLSAVLIVLSGCGHGNKNKTAQKPSYSVETAKEISYITGGVISSTEPVRVRFTHPIVDNNQVNAPLKLPVFRFSPEIPGHAVWQDGKTLAFIPDHPLKLGQSYTGKLDLSKLFPNRKKPALKEIPISFQVAKRELLRMDGQFTGSPSGDASLAAFEGTMDFSEPCTINMVKKAVSVKLDGRPVQAVWMIREDQKRFTFTISDISRGKSSRTLTVYVNPKPLGISSPMERTYLLDPAKVFKVSRSQQVQEGGPGIALIFSDRLDMKQDINGFISIKPAVKFTMKKSGRKIILTGEFKPGQGYTVTAREGIRSIWGSRLKKAAVYTVTFQNLKPAIQFVKDGIFLPSGNKQQLRFTAVNVRRVTVSVMKVFSSTLGQYLQVAEIDAKKNRRSSFNESERVGVKVAEQNLSLSGKLNDKEQYAIDLHKLIKKGELGMFLIRVSFNRNDMMPETKEARYGEYSDWNNDPKGPGYVWTHGNIYKPVLLTDIGLTHFSTGKHHVIVATNLISGKPLAGVSVELRTYQDQVIQTTVTNRDGKAEFAKVSDKVYYVRGRYRGNTTFLLNSAMAWNVSSFNIGGSDVNQDNLRAFLFTDRGVYRPGDEVHLALIVRNEDGSFPENHPVSLKLTNPRQQVALETTLRKGKDGIYAFRFRTSETDPTGVWQAEVTAGSRTFVHPIRIETVVPYKLKVRIKAEPPALTPDRKKLSLALSAKYLFGTPASGLNATLSLSLKKGRSTFKNFPGFRFVNETINFRSVTTQILNKKLDANGTAKASWTVPDTVTAPGPLVAEINGRVLEKGGRPNLNRIYVPVHTYNYYVGLRKPDFEYGYARTGEPFTVNAILVNTKGEAVSGHPVQWRLYRNNRFWWWEYRNRSSFQLKFKSDINTEKVASGEITSASLPVPIRINPEKRGEYYLEVQHGDGHTAGFFFSAYAWGESAGGGKTAGMIVLKADQPGYHPGETAVVTFPTPESGTLIYAVLKGNDILQTRVGDVGSDHKTSIKVPITADMAPNVYVAVSVIQPHNQTLNDRPMRLYGVVPLMVSAPDSHPSLKISVADKLKPGQKFQVGIQTGDHKPAQLFVAVVDEGLLDLTGFSTPDPWKFFYHKERLSAVISDVFPWVIGADKGDPFNVFSVGGDMRMAMTAAARQRKEEEGKRRRFKPVDMFRGPVSTDSSGKVVLNFTMPEYIGAVRIMAVAAAGTRYASAEKSVAVKKDLMVLPTLPRVVHPGDRIQVPVTVFAMKKHIGTVTVNISATGAAKVAGSSERKLTFDKTGEKDIFFTLEIPQALGNADIRIEARSSRDSAVHTTQLQSVQVSPRMYEWHTTPVKPGQSVTLKIPDKGMPGSNHARIVIRKRAELNIGHRLNWLLHYPYGCVEQTTSAAFPQLYLKILTHLTPEQEEKSDAIINRTIERLRKFQLADGGMSYWPGSTFLSPWGTNYAGHFLLEAKKRGYHVPEDMLSAWLQFEKSRAESTLDSMTTRTYRLYLLALAGQGNRGAMNLIRENALNKLSDTQKWLLAAAYKLSGMAETATDILKETGKNTVKSNNFDETYGSELRNQAILLELATRFRNWPMAEKKYTLIAKRLSSGEWLSTQTVAYSLLALGTYVDATSLHNGKPDKLSGTVTFPDKSVQSFDTAALSTGFELKKDFGKSITVKISPSVPLKQVYAVMEWDGIPASPVVAVMPKADGMSVKVEFLNENGMPVNPASLKQGTVFWGHFRVRCHKGQAYILHVALEQMLPTGWEIENTRLSGEAMPAWSRKWNLGYANYTDIRDDRIRWFFNLNRSRPLDFLVKLNAVSAGKFILPATVSRAMYNKTLQAVVPGRFVSVTRAKEN
ncbi:MAG: alpha-2-macroglobulin family protein [Acidobacteria bacterium]|nr:alpha-2-macroglobulin family protein [Acidobacteriota bacterium]